MFGDKSRVEIERKFLVTGDAWRQSDDCVHVRCNFCDNQATLEAVMAAFFEGERVRRVLGRGVITVKGPTRGISRVEYEYSIPQDEAEAMLQHLCVGTVIDKVRTRVPLDGVVWEVDEFSGENAGLILAEVELESEDQKLSLPDWIGKEVSDDPRYFNSYLARTPYSTWDQSS